MINVHFLVFLDGCHSCETVCLRIIGKLNIHHSNESWNPDKSIIIREFVDSIFRWNDEFKGNHVILGHTGKLKSSSLFYRYY